MGGLVSLFVGIIGSIVWLSMLVATRFHVVVLSAGILLGLTLIDRSSDHR